MLSGNYLFLDKIIIPRPINPIIINVEATHQATNPITANQTPPNNPTIEAKPKALTDPNLRVAKKITTQKAIKAPSQ